MAPKRRKIPEPDPIPPAIEVCERRGIELFERRLTVLNALLEDIGKRTAATLEDVLIFACGDAVADLKRVVSDFSDLEDDEDDDDDTCADGQDDPQAEANMKTTSSVSVDDAAYRRIVCCVVNVFVACCGCSCDAAVVQQEINTTNCCTSIVCCCGGSGVSRKRRRGDGDETATGRGGGGGKEGLACAIEWLHTTTFDCIPTSLLLRTLFRGAHLLGVVSAEEGHEEGSNGSTTPLSRQGEEEEESSPVVVVEPLLRMHDAPMTLGMIEESVRHNRRVVRMSEVRQPQLRGLTAEALSTYFTRLLPIRAAEAMLAQFVSNGMTKFLMTYDMQTLRAACRRLFVGEVAVSLANRLELINCLVTACNPPHSVLEAARDRWCGADVANAHKDECNDDGVSPRPTDYMHASDRSVIRIERVSHRTAMTTLSAVGGHSRSLDAVRKSLTEERPSINVTGRGGSTTPSSSRMDLLLHLTVKCNIPITEVVAAVANNRSDASNASGSGSPTEELITMLPLPTKAEFVSWTEEHREALYRSIRQLQFSIVQSQINKSDELLLQQRAHHVAQIPVDALYVLMRKTKTRDPFEQLLIRYWRIAFSRLTAPFELMQWVWHDEAFILAMNLLSLLGCEVLQREAIARAIQGLTTNKPPAAKLVDVILEAQKEFLRNEKGAATNALCNTKAAMGHAMHATIMFLLRYGYQQREKEGSDIVELSTS